MNLLPAGASLKHRPVPVYSCSSRQEYSLSWMPYPLTTHHHWLTLVFTYGAWVWCLIHLAKQDIPTRPSVTWDLFSQMETSYGESCWTVSVLRSAMSKFKFMPYSAVFSFHNTLYHWGPGCLAKQIDIQFKWVSYFYSTVKIFLLSMHVWHTKCFRKRYHYYALRSWKKKKSLVSLNLSKSNTQNRLNKNISEYIEYTVMLHRSFLMGEIGE